MKSAAKIIIFILAITVIIFIIAFFLKNETPIVGTSCGTVTPGTNDQCCYRQLKDENKFLKCNNPLIFYNSELDKCEYKCGEAEGIFCTQEAMECPDGSFVGRSPALNCSFIPCGYQ